MELIHKQFVSMGGLCTRLLTIGGHLGSKPKRLILIVPGNPGLSSYYEDFMLGLHQRLKSEQSVPAIWAIGHFGHDWPTDGTPMPGLTGHESLHNLEGQIAHKVRFIEEYVPPNCELTLIGHSIGCKMILAAMTQLRDKPIQIRAYLLFPTIERMYQSPSGFRTWIVCAYLRPLIMLIAYLCMTLVPQWLLRTLIRSHLGPNVSDVTVDTTIALANPRIARNSTYLAFTELLTVTELDVEELRPLLPQVRFYYGSEDHWCPLEFYEDLKSVLPQVDAVVCQEGIEHAFVLQSSDAMARIIGEWYKKDYK